MALTAKRPSTHIPTSPQNHEKLSRLTVDLQAPLLRALKVHAAESNLTIRTIVETLLTAELQRHGKGSTPPIT